MWPVATILDSASEEHFHHCSKYYLLESTDQTHTGGKKKVHLSLLFLLHLPKLQEWDIRQHGTDIYYMRIFKSRSY